MLVQRMAMKDSGRKTIGATLKKKRFGVVFGSMLMAFLLSGCGAAVSKISKEDLARFNQVTAIRAIHYDPAMSFSVLTPGKALMGGGGAIGGLITLGLSKSSGTKMMEEYSIGDPVILVKKNFITSCSAGFAGQSITSEEKPSTTDNIDELKKSYGDGWLFDFVTFQWTMTYYPTDWSHYRIFYSARGRLIDLGTTKVLWTGICNQEHEHGERPTFDQLTANKGELLKARLVQSAEECAIELWSKFQEHGD